MNASWLVLAGGLTMTMLITACQTPPPEQPETAPTNWNVLDAKVLATSHGKIDFVTHVKPILEAKCVTCHNKDVLPFFSLENREAAFMEGKLGPRIVPGKPEQSAILAHIQSAHIAVKTMPPVGDRLTDDEKRIVTAWIQQGAAWPPGEAGTLNPHAEHQR